MKALNNCTLQLFIKRKICRKENPPFSLLPFLFYPSYEREKHSLPFYPYIKLSYHSFSILLMRGKVVLPFDPSKLLTEKLYNNSFIIVIVIVVSVIVITFSPLKLDPARYSLPQTYFSFHHASGVLRPL